MRSCTAGWRSGSATGGKPGANPSRPRICGSRCWRPPRRTSSHGTASEATRASSSTTCVTSSPCTNATSRPGGSRPTPRRRPPNWLTSSPLPRPGRASKSRARPVRSTRFDSWQSPRPTSRRANASSPRKRSLATMPAETDRRDSSVAIPLASARASERWKRWPDRPLFDAPTNRPVVALRNGERRCLLKNH